MRRPRRWGAQWRRRRAQTPRTKGPDALGSTMHDATVEWALDRCDTDELRAGAGVAVYSRATPHGRRRGPSGAACAT